MIRSIEAFQQDDDGDWVAQLSCLHRQHMRHEPPFQERPWVETAEGRASRIGGPIDCPLCDRSELPEGLQVARSITFDDQRWPAGLRRDHRVAARTWARLRVVEGSVRFTMAADPPLDRVLSAGDEQAIPPEVLHAVEPEGRASVTIEFLVPSA